MRRKPARPPLRRQGRFASLARRPSGPSGYAYVDAELADGTIEKLFRLHYAGSAHMWGFAIYRYSKDGYEESFLPSGSPGGTPEEALDCAAGLYLNDPTAWLPPTN